MLQVRILDGDGRETFDCLHQGMGQQFDIDAGKACDKVFVPQTRWVTMTFTATFNRDFLEPITTFVLIPYLSIIIRSVTVVVSHSQTCLGSFSTYIKLINLCNNHCHCDLHLSIIWDRLKMFKFSQQYGLINSITLPYISPYDRVIHKAGVFRQFVFLVTNPAPPCCLDLI